MKIRIGLLAIVICFSWIGRTQDRDTLKVMSYNLLNFPSLGGERIDTLKDILAYVKPDILMVCELTSGAGADAILFNALNEDGESVYDMADYISGPDTQNQLYFNSNKLGLFSQGIIPTVLRDINEYVLYYKSTDLSTTVDTIFFYVYVCHLKASAGNEAQRNTESIALKEHLSTLSKAENIIVGGDFNFYSSETEPAWETLLSGSGVLLNDPIDAPGNWHNTASFSWLHTQSTRTTVFDGGAYGGMDDRFDFIFIGSDLVNYSNDAGYLDDSYRAMGQDGAHYNQSILDAPVNSSAPSAIISKLHNMSDHLPILLEIEVVKETVGIMEVKPQKITAYFDAFHQKIVLKGIDNWELQSEVFIYDLNGKLVKKIDPIEKDLIIPIMELKRGSYLLQIPKLKFHFKFTI